MMYLTARKVAADVWRANSVNPTYANDIEAGKHDDDLVVKTALAALFAGAEIAVRQLLPTEQAERVIATVRKELTNP